VHAARTHLRGNVRHRIKRAIDGLADDPRPHGSLTLDVSELDIPPGVELRRLRIDRWRIVYAVNDDEDGDGAPISSV
jgi:mRNA-degrading endonuclease RelE of RelBE toxin-antitoxin system